MDRDVFKAPSSLTSNTGRVEKSPLLELVQVPLDGTPSFKCVSSANLLGLPGY